MAKKLIKRHYAFKVGDNVVLNESFVIGGKHIDRGVELIIQSFNPSNGKPVNGYRGKYVIECIDKYENIYQLSVKQIVKSESNWVITDDDCNQWGRQMTQSGVKLPIFQFSELRFNGTENVLYESTVETGDLEADELEELINTYGYTKLEERNGLFNIDKLYGNNANWIIAEIMFEMEY